MDHFQSAYHALEPPDRIVYTRYAILTRHFKSSAPRDGQDWPQKWLITGAANTVSGSLVSLVLPNSQH